MRKIMAIFLAVALMAGMCAVSAQASEMVFLQNGTMETANEDNTPAGWTVEVPTLGEGEASSAVLSDTNNQESGKKSLQLTSTAAGVLRVWQKSEAVNVASAELSKGNKYRISADIYIPEGTAMTTGVRIVVYRGNNWTAGNYNAQGYIGTKDNGGVIADLGITETGGEWKTVSALFGRSTSMTGAYVAIELSGAGTAYVDNVKIEQVTETILNGDFDAYSHNGEGWTAAPAGVTLAGAEIVRDAETGNGYVKIATDAADRVKLIATGLPSEAGLYLVEYLYETDSTDTWSGRLYWTNSTISDLGETMRRPGGKLSEWTPASFYVPKPEGTNYIELAIDYWDNAKYGASYIDDVRISPATDAVSFVSGTTGEAVETVTNADGAKVRIMAGPEKDMAAPTAVPSLIVAAYKKQGNTRQLTGITIAEAESVVTEEIKFSAVWGYATEITCTVPSAAEADEYEVFVWDSTAGLKPVLASVTAMSSAE